MHLYDRFATSAACYVHMPFCSRVCPYCDFAVVEGQDHLIPRYISAVRSEIAGDSQWRPLDAVFFGGGTPSHVPASELGVLLDALSDKHGVTPDAEVSLEANPEDFTADRAREFRSVGFNRVSFGAQSFDGLVLLYLGRRHQAPQIVEAVAAARQAGFENVSVDLIYGSPGETDSSWGATLEAALGLEVDHISCYSLTVERGTPLGREVNAGAPAPDPDQQADRYEKAQATLADAGFLQYEVSNWAQPDMECRYNLTVWAQGEYLAYGNGAHGFRDHVRFRNLRRLDAYLAAVESSRPARAGEDELSGWDLEVDRLFVGLRRRVGVAHGEGTRALAASPEGQRLADAGVIAETPDRLSVARPLLTDMVHRAVLGLPPR